MLRPRLIAFGLGAALMVPAAAGAAPCAGSGTGDCPYTSATVVQTTPPTTSPSASLRFPTDVAVDASGNAWVSDTARNQVVEYGPSGSVLRRLGPPEGGAGDGEFQRPAGLGLDGSGHLYVVDAGNSRVEKFDPDGTFVRAYGSAGHGDGQLFQPTDVAVTTDGATLYVADGGNARVVPFDGSTGVSGTAFGAPGTGDGQFSLPVSIGVTGSAPSTRVYVLDGSLAHRVEIFDGAGAYQSQFATSTGFNSPNGLAVDAAGSEVAVTSGNSFSVFDPVNPASPTIGPIGSDGSQAGEFSSFDSGLAANGIAIDPSAANGGDFLVVDVGNARVQRFEADGSADALSTRLGGPRDGEMWSPEGVAREADGRLVVSDTGFNRLQLLGADGLFADSVGRNGGDGSDGNGAAAEFQHPDDVYVDPNVGPNPGDTAGDLYVADTENNRILRLKDDGSFLGSIYPFAIGHPLSAPHSVAVDASSIYVADTFHHQVMVLDRATGNFVTTYGSNGSGAGQFSLPHGVDVAPDGDLWVADSQNNRVQVRDHASGDWTPYDAAGSLSFPTDVAFDAVNGVVWVADNGNSRIVALDPVSGDVVATFGSDGSGTGEFHYPQRVVVDGSGGLIVADTGNDRIQRFSGFSVGPPPPPPDTTAPQPKITTPDQDAVVNTLRPVLKGTAGDDTGDSGQVTVQIRQSGELKDTLVVNRSGTAWSATADVDLSEGGTFTATVSQDDAAGHTGTSDPRTFRVGFPPVNTKAPSISGQALVGSVLHADVGDWTGTAPTTLTVFWERCGDTDVNHCTPVAADYFPKGLDYRVQADDVGHRLILRVKGSNFAGVSEAYAPSFTGIVVDPNTPGGLNGSLAGSPNVEPPVVGHTPAQSSAACQQDLFFGPVGVHADCLRRVGLTWEATGKVSVNGLHITPAAGAKVVIDPMNLRVAAHGSVTVSVGPTTVAGVTLGPFILYSGSIDWVMQANVKLPDVPGLATQIPNFGGVGNLPSLGKLDNLPGLGALASLPRLPDGLPDFSKLTVGDLSKLRIPTLDALRMQVPAFYLPVAQLPAIGVDVGKAASLFGLPVQGKLAMRMVDQGAQFDVGLGLPALGNLSAESTFRVFNDGRFELDTLKAHADEVNAGIVDLRPLDIQFDGARNLWNGTAGAYLPFPGAPGLDATASILDGRLKRVGLGYDGSLAIGATGVFLSHIDFVLDNGPPQQFTSKIDLTAGPPLPKLPPAVGLDGAFIYQAADPAKAGDSAKFALTGKLAVVGHQLAKAGAEYHTNGYFHAFGDIDVHVGPGNAFGVHGGIDGAVDKTAFDMAGKLVLDVPGLPGALKAEGAVSSAGIAGCGAIGPLQGGASYRWATNAFSLFGGCDLSSFHPLGASARASQAGTRTVTLPNGLKGTALAIHGAGAPPKVVLTGPGGRSVTTPADSIDAVKNDRFFLVQSPMDNTTYVLLVSPPGGAWTITTEPRSAAIRSIDQSDPLPAVSVRARVTGHGHHRRLAWSLRPIAGQEVQFFERSSQVGRLLGRATRGRGALSFAPADGPAGSRRIVAVVLQDGLVRKTIDVGRYSAPAPLRLAAPRRVRLAVKGSGLSVRWRRVRGAVRYRVRATVNGGRHVLIAPKGHATSAVMPGVFGDQSARVRVMAVDAAGREGRAGSAKRGVRRVRKPQIPGLPAPHKKAKRH